MPQPDNTVGNVVIKVEEAAPKQQKAKQVRHTAPPG